MTKFSEISGMISETTLQRVLSRSDIFVPFLEKLKDLYGEMDRLYDDAASRYDFICTGCDDNCCRTRFYHHTLLEYLYLNAGCGGLSGEPKKHVIDRARHVNRQMNRERSNFGPMCPLNVDGRCIVYKHRPMICRLHGIPHELHTPGKGVRHHPGCNAFHNACDAVPYVRFDRTALYVKIAGLEKELKATLGVPDRVRMTVAEMIVTYGLQP